MKKKRDWMQLLVLTAAIGLLTTNILLIVQNARLRSKLANAPLYTTEKGYKFDKLKLTDLDGKDKTIDFSNEKRKTLLLFFNTACVYCKQQYPHWKELVKKADPEKWRVIYVTKEKKTKDIKTRLEETGISNAEVFRIDSADASNARMGYTPLTIAISETGEVEKVWTGLSKSIDRHDF